MQTNGIEYKVELDFYLIQQSNNTSAPFTIPNIASTGTPYYTFTDFNDISTNFPSIGDVNNCTPTIQFSNLFGKIIGFYTFSDIITTNIYPVNDKIQCQEMSNIVPCLNAISSLIITCNLVHNQLILPSGILSSVAISVANGAYLSLQSPQISFSDCSQSNVSFILISIFDQNMNSVVFNDTDILIVIAVRDKLLSRA